MLGQYRPDSGADACASRRRSSCGALVIGRGPSGTLAGPAEGTRRSERCESAHTLDMTDDQIAALVSFGVPAILLRVYSIGHRVGAGRAVRVIDNRLQHE